MAKNFISNKDETARMFSNPFLEKFSKIHWSVPLFLYVPAVIFFLYKAFFVSGCSAIMGCLLCVAGIALWTLAEYCLHRFLFHAHFKGNTGKRISFIMHGVHHDYPKDSKRLVMVPTISVPLAVVFYAIFYGIFGNTYVNPIYAGFVAGYLIYDMTHYAIHYYNTKSRYWAILKKHHSLHHYADPNSYYGVSTRVWDKIFGTPSLKSSTKPNE